MRCRGPLVTLLATAAVLTTVSAEVTITDNGYSGLLVGISKDVPEDPSFITLCRRMKT